MSTERWTECLRFSSLVLSSPLDEQLKKDQISAYVQFLEQMTSSNFPEEIAQLIQEYYPSNEKRLLDEVLAIFVLHNPEHGHAVLHPILSLIIDGTLSYDRDDPPFSWFISLVGPTNEKDYSEQRALACGEILRVLTHYNRPIYKYDRQENERERRSSGSHATTSGSMGKEAISLSEIEEERRPSRPLSPWITDLLLSAPLGIRSDYFRWCGGVTGKYAATEELKPPITASSSGSGKQPQLMPSTPRWAVANGAGVILSVCDEEVSRYETAKLTAAAVPSLLLPPPTTPFDDHLVAGLPPLEPYARLFHRYYAIATPSATQRLLLGLLEAPPSWAPDALDAAVQLVELLRAAEDYVFGMRLPKNWMHLHFLRAIGTALSLRAGVAADAAAALLFRILSQPTLLFPPSRFAAGVEVLNEPSGENAASDYKQREAPDDDSSLEATAQGIASMLCAHGPEVEWRICTIWEAAYGILPLSSAVDLPEIIVHTASQPPLLSWNLYLPMLRVLEHLPRGSPSEACLMRIFVATVEAILQRTFPTESLEQKRKSKPRGSVLSTTRNLAVAELRTMVHSLFLESCASTDLASRLLFVSLSICICYEVLPSGSKIHAGNPIRLYQESTQGPFPFNLKTSGEKMRKRHGPVAAFDSYVQAAVCALACELQLFPSATKNGKHLDNTNSIVSRNGKSAEVSNGVESGIGSAICHTRRFLEILEALFLLKPSSCGTSWGHSSNEVVAAAMVAAHVSELFRRSKVSMNSLSVLMRSKWDVKVSSRASSLYHLIDIHGKTIASITRKAERLEIPLASAPLMKNSEGQSGGDGQIKSSNFCSFATEEIPLQTGGHNDSGDSGTAEASANCKKALQVTDAMLKLSDNNGSNFPLDASNLANFLTTDRHIGIPCSAQALLRSVLCEKQEMCFSVISLLWHKLITAPEIELNTEGTSATLHGWRQAADALCNVVLASPTPASAAIVLQAEKDLQPWIARDNRHSKKMWRINKRIVKLIADLMRNHENPEALAVVSSASDLLLRATDGMLVDGEECAVPQLELLEATARAVQLMQQWDESGFVLADGLSNLLKCRLPVIVRCLSYPSAHVRCLSVSILRYILDDGRLPKNPCSANGSRNNTYHSSCQSSHVGMIDWHEDINKCLKWEACGRQATGMTLSHLNAAAQELGYDGFDS